MSKTLYVTDLDGTLMRDDETISDETVRIINTLISNGMIFTYATARSIISSSYITRNISFDIPVITRNGTILANNETREIIYINKFQKKEIMLLKEVLNGVKLYGFVTAFIDGRETKLYVKDNMNEGFTHYLSRHLDDKRLISVKSQDELFISDMCYLTLIDKREALEPIYNKVKENDNWNCIFQQDKYRLEYWLEISPKCATKALAIKKLKEYYHCDKLVVFGDSLNDISMFEIADEAYAVYNAMKKLKDIATSVIMSNEDDGISKWLEENINK